MEELDFGGILLELISKNRIVIFYSRQVKACLDIKKGRIEK
jgi:hypothetical protein